MSPSGYISGHDGIPAAGLSIATCAVGAKVRDYPHGIFGSCARYPRPYQMGRVVGMPPSSPPSVGFTGELSPPDARPCLISKGQVLAQMVSEPKRSKLMVQMGRKSTGPNPAVFPDSGVIPENAWSFSIPRFTGHTRMLGPSVFPDSGVLRMLGPLMPKV